jgi:hypothetical protein
LKTSTVVTALVLLVCVLLVAVVGLRWLMPGMVYPVPPVSVGGAPAGFSEIELKLPDGTTVNGWLYRTPAAADTTPVVVYFHGNAENLETLKQSQQLAAFQQMDVHLLAIDYPGYGLSGGSPNEQSLRSTADAAVAYAQQQFPENPLILMGWSLGAAVALVTAAEHPAAVDGVIALSPWSSLPEAAADHYPQWLVGLIIKEQYNVMEAAKKITCPVLLVHGEQDELIPAAHSERIAVTLKGIVQYMRVFEAGHSDLLAHSDVWSALHHFVRNFTRSDFGQPPKASQ